MGYYHIAQICKNGHMVNDRADTNQARNKNFCPDCGAETITACPECGANIHGDYDVPGLAVIGAIGATTPVESFCYNCGAPYPWTKAVLLAASGLIYEEENIPDDLKERTVETLKDIISETPNTTLAATRLKKCLASVGTAAAEGLRQFAIDFGCELAKKLLAFDFNREKRPYPGQLSSPQL